METVFYPADERGKANHGWLKAAHSFSFANYFDPKKMGFETLRVLNDDSIAAGKGFGSHPHNNMEIITIPLRGALEHQDSMGNKGVITSGEVQVMSAGSGVTHSEYNASQSEEVSLLQIWIESREHNIAPRYDQKQFDFPRNEWTLVVSPDEREGSLLIYQNTFFSVGHFSKNQEIVYKKRDTNTEIYLFLIEGEVALLDHVLSPRDALAISGQAEIEVKINEDTKILLLEVAKS